MLLLASRLLPGRIAVATADHGLRDHSADEAATVAALCGQLGVPHQTLALALEPGTAMPERARTARYAALGAWAHATGLGAIVTAHHADDQAETLVMRLNRGAGLKGLAGMRARAIVPGHGDLPLLRPLLGWTKGELGALVGAAGLAAADDPTNRDAHYERTRVRQALAQATWLDARALARTAAHLAQADAALDWAASQAFAGLEHDGETLLWGDSLPTALALRVLERVIGHFAGPAPRGRELAQWLVTLESHGIGTLGGVRGDARTTPWRFRRASPHQ